VKPRHAIFLDVDGTYADRGVVPDGHVAAVRAARAMGHVVLLCTGRPKSMLPPRILEAGFDGVVAAAGGYVEVDGRVLVDRRFPPELAARVVRLLDAHRAAYVLEAPEGLLGPPGVDRRLTELLGRYLGSVEAGGREGPVDILDVLVMAEDLEDASFGKVTVFESPVPVPVLAEELGPDVGALPSSIPGMGGSAGELYLTGVHKAVGIELVTEHLGIPRRDVIAFGDGMNDVEMLAHAGIGVAIEGSDPRVVAAADRLAAGPEEEGLATAFAELGLV
jgi:Cof subfamily protein (haloacid dehalogenase superfamily)